MVIAQSVARNTEIDTTEQIILTISKGPGVKKNVVPKVEGLPFKDALKLLNDFDFTNVDEEYVYSDKPENEVIYQSVAQGTEIDVKTKIVLRVSQGPEPTEPPTEVTEVPKVTKTVTIQLPVKEDAYELGIYFEGKPVRETIIVPAGTGQITIDLSGNGFMTFVLYVDGVALDQKLEVDFGNG